MKTKLYKIQKDNKVYNILERPAFIIDTNNKCIVAASEIEEIQEMYKSVYKVYASANRQDNLIMLELPLDQNIIDNAFADINIAIELYNRSNGVAHNLSKSTLNNIIRELNARLKSLETEKKDLLDTVSTISHENREMSEKLNFVHERVKDFMAPSPINA